MRKPIFISFLIGFCLYLFPQDVFAMSCEHDLDIAEMVCCQKEHENPKAQDYLDDCDLNTSPHDKKEDTDCNDCPAPACNCPAVSIVAGSVIAHAKGTPLFKNRKDELFPVVPSEIISPFSSIWKPPKIQ